MSWATPSWIATDSKCGCFACLDNGQSSLRNPAQQFMILCEHCGNKRCPHATDHDNTCTRSNEPGQPGSRYE